VIAARLARIAGTLLVAAQMPCWGVESQLVEPTATVQPTSTDSMADMPYREMATLMAMDDAAAIGKAMLDQLEIEGDSGHTTVTWDAQAWYGSDYNKIWFKSEGSPDPSDKTDSRNELLWDHVFARWWSVQTGARYDLGQGPARGWAALGIQGLAPYWFDIEATLYAGDAGRTAVRFRAERDVLITQRLIAQPELEFDLYGKSDPAREIGSGLSDSQLGLRIRYEIRREIAPYAGITWRRDYGSTAQYSRASGLGPNALLWVVGLRIWF
jgi:copper resistance protein B